MSVETASMFWVGVALYLAVGVVVAAPIALWGASRTDHAARGAGLLFQLTIAPGIISLWPFVLLRVLSGRVVNRPIADRSEQ